MRFILKLYHILTILGHRIAQSESFCRHFKSTAPTGYKPAYNWSLEPEFITGFIKAGCYNNGRLSAGFKPVINHFWY